MKLSQGVAGAVATVFILGIIALSGLSIWAATETAAIRGVSGLHAANGRVYVAVDRNVWICDEQGHCTGKLRDATGKPFVFDVVSTLNTATNGDVYAADGETQHIEIFKGDGEFIRTVVLQKPPGPTFEALALGDTMVVADTIGHQLRLIDANGKDLKTVNIRYPNGLSRYSTPDGEVLVVAETGRARPAAFNARLELLSLAEVTRLTLAIEGMRDPSGNHELLELATGPDGRLAISYCRNTSGDCTFYTYDRAGKETNLGELELKGHPHPELVENGNMSGEITFTSRGTLLVASPRMTQIYELGDGATKPFGDAELQNALVAMRDLLPRWAQVEAVGRWGTLLLSALMVGLFVVARQTGVFTPEKAQQRLNAIWMRVVRPAMGAYLALAASALGGAIAFGLLGWTKGPGVGIAAALGGAMLGVRMLGVRLFVARQTRSAATDAFALQLGTQSPLPVGLAPDEKVLWASFARPLGGSARDDLLAAAEFARESDLLEPLAPPLQLVTRTTHRLFVARCSVVGSPLDDVAVADVPPAELLEAPGTLAFGGFALLLRAQGPKSALKVPATWLCQECRRPLGSCTHRGGAVLPAVALGLIFPGLGQLAQRRFGRARTTMLAAIAASSDALPQLIPQWTGRLPFDASAWFWPLTAFFVAALGGIADVLVFSALRRGRR